MEAESYMQDGVTCAGHKTGNDWQWQGCVLIISGVRQPEGGVRLLDKPEGV